MLLRLLPDQAARYWDSVKAALLAAPPPASRMTEEGLNEILAYLLVGNMQCWVAYRKSETGPVVEGIALTTVIMDLCSKTKNLLLYCVYAYPKTEMRAWAEGRDALRKYAISLGCANIIGYSKEERWRGVTERLGGEIAYMIIIPCEGGGS